MSEQRRSVHADNWDSGAERLDYLTEPHIPGTNDSGEPTAKLTVEVVQRRTIEIDVFIPYEEAWRRREELAAPFLTDEAGEPLWTAAHYSIEGRHS